MSEDYIAKILAFSKWLVERGHLLSEDEFKMLWERYLAGEIICVRSADQKQKPFWT